MGMDSYLFKRGKTNKGKMLLALEGNKLEIEYWRKNYFIHELFASFRKKGQDDNVTEILITKENLLECLKIIIKEKEENKPILELINKLLAETDFNNEEIIYYAWY